MAPTIVAAMIPVATGTASGACWISRAPALGSWLIRPTVVAISS
ncbi:MAG TPA: hypothetical protein VFQ77_10460 [Pseudonocardiaceae bacterium]|nr:hypothetical protein [Pseudonocardiaceae bacterium]